MYLCPQSRKTKPMKVCIAEKPSVAREIAKILGANDKKDGYLEGNGYYVTWVFGHLCELKEPQEYTPYWKPWNINTLPMIPQSFGIRLKKDSGVKHQFEIIKKLVENSEGVINCGDAGQEGELIQRWVLHHTKINRPVQRLWISSLTEQSIKEGFENLLPASQFDKLYAAGSARAIGDWLLGMNATRAYTIRFAPQKQILSIGRVQTPTLALIVSRDAEIKNFKSEIYWELKTKYRDVLFTASQSKFSDKEQANKIIERIKDKEFEITDFQQKDGFEAPPKLFDLTSLQVECNSKFGFSADATLKLIQSLYEKKLTTYPRVDTTYLSDDLYPKIPDTLRGLKPYSNFVEPLLKEPIRKSKKVFDNSKVTDHHAIIPTGVEPRGDLSYNEKLVYDLVARRFIAAFYPDSKVSNTSVVGKVDDVEFKCSGKQILTEAWRVLFPKKEKDEDNKDKDQETILPEFTIGEKGAHTAQLTEKKTTPPKPYTEATLLRAMETAGKTVEDEELRQLMKDNGIGRPSTRAAIIETLFKRQYIKKEKKNLIPTITGIQLISVIKDDILKSVELTGQWEKKLRMIERGEYSTSDFMQEMREMVTQTVEKVKNDNYTSTIQAATKTVEKAKKTSNSNNNLTCPKCGKSILTGKSAWGCSGYKDGCNFVIPFEFNGKKISDSQVKTLISKKEVSLKNGKIIINDDYKLEFVEVVKKEISLEDLKCPICQKNLLQGKTAYGCSGFREGCNFKMPFEFMGKKLTLTHLEQLCNKLETNKITGLIDNSGSKISGKLVFDKQSENLIVK